MCAHGRPELPRNLWTANLMFDRRLILLTKRYAYRNMVIPASYPAEVCSPEPTDRVLRLLVRQVYTPDSYGSDSGLRRLQRKP
jgi:hypothetical protein